MFKELAISLDKFAKERNWTQFHHPKNLILNIFVELSELTEHLVDRQCPSFKELKNDKKKMEGIKDELGDILINLTHFSKAIKVSINECQVASLDPTYTPSQIIHRLYVTIGHLAEPLTWVSEAESRSFINTDEMPSILKEAVSIALFFAQQVGLNPVETARLKMAKIELKYPVGMVSEDATIYYRNKAKNRKRHDES